ncbi:hypothetical protein [Streptomyces sp. NPDC047315]|uniref:hypothetical protein n=1 Tax=Streptomyces sp. NPDC047315 TaxID=3155142 RepID=UPI0033D66EB8
MVAPVVVHRPSPSGGRRVTVRNSILGVAYSDADLIEFLRAAGLDHAEALVGSDTTMIEWRGGRAHQYDTS